MEATDPHLHLTVGEATITLQDTAVILGLPIDGHAVIGHGEGEWAALVLELLGIMPVNPQDPTETKIIVGSSLKLTWLRDHFRVLAPDADVATIEMHARAYILYLFGCILFPDKSGDSVQLIYLPLLRDLRRVAEYSWGSATLAYLYRNLCRASRKGAKDIAGCLLLLQIWSWEHIHIGRPVIRMVRPQFDEADDLEPVLGSQHQRGRDPLAVSWLRVHLSWSHSPHTLVYYRDSLDRQRDDQMTWQPYTITKMEALPDICRDGQVIWRSRCPLICFDIVEYYLPDRVMRQFSLEQPIPEACDTKATLHAIDWRTADKNFQVRHRSHVDAWNDRENLTVQGETYTSQSLGIYMAWYRQITILRITNPTSANPASHYHPTATILAERIRSVLL